MSSLEFDGLAINLVKQARGSKRLVRLITGHLPRFRAQPVHRGRLISFLAGQIASGGHYGPIAAQQTLRALFSLLRRGLTMFADYRLPPELQNVGAFGARRRSWHQGGWEMSGVRR
jgi:hypothetical protein